MDGAKERMKALGIGIPDILLPKKEIDLKKWAVVACDQYTSELDYWQRVEKFVGDESSSLRLILPEVYLERENLEQRIESIHQSMINYSHDKLFDEYKQNFFLVHRTTPKGPGRWGLMVSLDLEKYDYSVSSRSPIRATEGTILDRIPPRKLIREGVEFELPHIIVLINDEYHSVLGPLITIHSTLTKVYETELMENGGTISGYKIDDSKLFDQIATAFEKLSSSLDPKNPILFAMGDGNHSLATAKSCWEDIKKNLTDDEMENHPARYALAEVMNIFDPGLVFEPIHRVMFNLERERFLEHLGKYCEQYHIEPYSSIENVLKDIEEKENSRQKFGYIDSEGLKVIRLDNPKAFSTAGTLQLTLDSLIKEGVSVDYIHGEDVTEALGVQKGNIGLFLPAIDKHNFFDTIKRDGALPRKTFSMGEAHEKRFYIEARRIK
ncbi:MAG: DUF1015 domain-containing protein [Sphaerochaetaceae bacterium]|jgi:hypothetical protein